MSEKEKEKDGEEMKNARRWNTARNKAESLKRNKMMDAGGREKKDNERMGRKKENNGDRNERW